MGRCRCAANELAELWQNTAPTSAEIINNFYEQADTYLYDLTWWHALGNDDSALIQVEALEVALAHRASAVLDFGSGIGSLGILLARHGLNVTLGEINPYLQDYARWRIERRGITAQFLDLRTEEVPPNTFDFISVVDVLEHLPNPQATLVTLASALQPGGTLFVHFPSTPSALHPMHLLQRPEVVINSLTIAGLSVERIVNSTLILRRGEGWRYTTASRLELCRRKSGGGMLLTVHPLGVISLNSQAFDIMVQLEKNPCTAVEIAAMISGFPFIDVVNLLNNFVRRGILIATPPLPTRWPAVSLIVPALGRANQTRACVESLLALDYDLKGLEIIVVDDGSNPPLAPVLNGLPVKLLRAEVNIGQSAARNLAAAVAQGELLAFIDNDCEAEPNWLCALIPHMDDPAIGIVGGRVISPPPSGQVAVFKSIRSPLDMGDDEAEVDLGGTVPFLPACNLIIRRDVFSWLKGFDSKMLLGEDVDLIWRALRAGIRVRYVPAGNITHHHRTKLAALLRRRLDYGSAEADIQRRHPEARRVITIPFVGVALLAALLSWPTSRLASEALLVLAITSFTIEVIHKILRLRQIRAQLPMRRVVGAILREHGAAIYYLGSNIARYYSGLLLIMGFLWPPLLLVLVILFSGVAITDYHRLKPRLPLPIFVGLCFLEFGAYQIGVWSGCLKWHTFRPLLPILRLGR